MIRPDEAGTRTVICDVSTLTATDVGTVDLLARLQVAVRQRGGALVLQGVRTELQELLALSGLDDVLVVEVVGKPEEPEQVGAEEIGDRGDPVA